MKKSDKQDPNDSVNRRLDALIRVIAETLYATNKKFEEGDIIRLLNSAGLTPTEIAKIMGRKGRGSVSGELYASKSKVYSKRIKNDKQKIKPRNN